MSSYSGQFTKLYIFKCTVFTGTAAEKYAAWQTAVICATLKPINGVYDRDISGIFSEHVFISEPQSSLI